MGVSSLSKDINEETVEVRGHVFVLRERSAGEHREIEKLATKKTALPDGSEVDEIDREQLNILLLDKSIVSVTPPLENGLSGLGYRATLALRTVVNALHYGPIDKTALQIEKEEAEADKKAGEDKAAGKG